MESFDMMGVLWNSSSVSAAVGRRRALPVRASCHRDSRRDAGATGALQTSTSQVVDQVVDAGRVAPFVVVPRDDLHAVTRYHQCHGRIHDGRTAITLEVRRNQLTLLVSQVAFQRAALGSSP